MKDFRSSGLYFLFVHTRIRFLFLWVLLASGLSGAAPAATAFRQTSAPWEQVDPKFDVALGMERDAYEPADRSGRFVIALQCGKGARPGDFNAAWAVTREGREVGSGTGLLSDGMLVVDFDLADLPLGSYEVTARVHRDNQEVAVKKGTFEVRANSQAKPETRGKVPLILPSGVPETPDGYPVSFGVPFPRGALKDLSRLRVRNADGREIPAQFRVRGLWAVEPAAGIRWLGVDVQLPKTAAWWPDRKEQPLFLDYGQKAAKAAPSSPLLLETTPEGIQVNTGPLKFLVRSQQFNLLDNVTLNGAPVLFQDGGGGAYLVDQNGAIYRAANDREPMLTVEESGPLRAVIRIEGWYVKDGTRGENYAFTLPTDKLCKFITRIEAHAGLPWVRILHTWVNTSDSYSVFFNDIGFSLRRPENVSANFGVVGSAPIQTEVNPGGVFLIQHLSNAFEVRREDGTVLAQGEKSDGTLEVATTDGSLLSLALRDTWQRFPKEMEILPQEIRLHLWPAHGRLHPEIDPFAKDRYHQLWFAHQGKLLDLRFPWETLFSVMRFTDNPSTGIYKPGGTAMGGVQSSAMGTAITADFMVHFSERTRREFVRQDLTAFENNPVGMAEPRWITESGVLGPAHPYDPENFAKSEQAAEHAIKGLWNLQSLTGEYGMFLYRGWHHNKYLGAGHWAPYRLYSAGHHYDPYLPWLYYARSGDPLYEEIGMAGMRHLTDLAITHFADPNYEHTEFYSLQKKLVGATGHTNGFVLWGGDHAILSHQTSYGAIILAYYLTGDLRLREVVTEEWQKTLLADRLNPEWDKAARMNWGKNVPEINRDNNNALGEMLDLYQLTHDPRLLALTQPCVESMEQNMYSWARELENVLSFRRSPKLARQVIEASTKRQQDPRSSLYYAFNGYTERSFAVAAWLAPERGFQRDALWAISRNELINAPPETWSWDRPSPLAYSVADTFLMLPMIMDVSRPLIKPGWEEEILPTQHLPIASELGGNAPTKTILKEDKDGTFTLTFHGKITSPNARIRVVAPDGSVVINQPLPRADDTLITLPKDGLTGEYILWTWLQAHQDVVQLPISSLNQEVYVTDYWILQLPQCYFLGAPNQPGDKIELAPGKNILTIEKRENFEVLAQRTINDYDSTLPLQCTLPKEGAWLVISQGTYFTTPKNAPLILTLNPKTFFQPTPESLRAIPKD